MRTFLFILYLVGYLITSAFKALKLKFIKKHGNKEESDKYIYDTSSKWGRDMLQNIGAKVVIEGKENLPEGNCLFVGNHQGYADIPLMLGYMGKPMGFIAKKEMEKIPIMSYWMRQMNCIFIDRENIRESVKSINEGAEILKNGYSMVIFPEGTRSKGTDVNEFKKGSMKLGIKSGVPIVPVSIDGSYKIYEGNGNRIKPALIKVVIDKPIYPNELTKEQQNNITETVRNIIIKNMKR